MANPSKDRQDACPPIFANLGPVKANAIVPTSLPKHEPAAPFPVKSGLRRLWAVVLTLSTYFLLCTDIFRCDTIVKHNMIEYEPYSFIDFGPYAYPVIAIHNHSNGTYNGIKRGKQLNSARIWSYKYDSTSIALRAYLRTSNLIHIHPLFDCLTYGQSFSGRCDQSSTISLEDAFFLLDTVVESISTKPAPYTVQEYQRNSSSHRVRYNVRLIAQWQSRLQEFLLMKFVQQVRVRSARGTYFNSNNSIKICDRLHDRPLFCSAGKLSDFNRTSNIEKFKKIGNIRDSIQDRYSKLQKNHFPNEVDMVIFESYADPKLYQGGLISLAGKAYDTVTIMRVRNCSSETCQTILVDDYRYEGRVTISNFSDWSGAIAFFRYFAQVYFWVRLLCLFLGCYIAKKALKVQTSFLQILFYEIPNQPVVYGSIFPVMLHALAHAVDGPINDELVRVNLLEVDGVSTKNLLYVLSVVSTLMRNVWVFAVLTYISLSFSSLNFKYHEYGIQSVRGHVFGFLSLSSIIFGIHRISLRNTKVTAAHETELDHGIFMTHFMSSSNHHVGILGIYSDIVNLVFAVISLAVLSYGLKFVLCLLFYVSPWKLSHIFPGFLFRSSKLPSSCGVLWSPMCLCCSWSGDLLQSSDYTIVPNSLTKGNLMNIVFLSDPMNYILLRSGFVNAKLFFYRSTTNGRVVIKCSPLTLNPSKDEYEYIKTIDAKSASWASWVECS